MSQRHTVFPDRSTVYLTTQGWRASTPWGRTSPPQPTRADALVWLARRLRERQKQEAR